MQIVKWLSHRALIAVRGVTFFAMAGFGAVLSIISIAVLPELQKPSIPDEVSVQRLRTSLDSGQVAWEARHAVPLALTIDSASSAAIRAGTTAKARALNELHAQQQSLISVWDAQRAALAVEGREAVRATAFTYGAEVTQPGERDRVQRFLALKAWHQDETARTSSALNAIRSRLVAANVALHGARHAPGDAVDAVRVAEARAHMAAAALLLDTMTAFQPAPARPEVRLSGHPFAALGSWLRSQRSLELASIIGMIGVGVLGAAVSTLVRGSGKRAVSIPVGNDLTGVLLRGFTAAFATFLAIKGSLAVVGTDGASANPYVLLLTCFVAAVYWEDAWARVRKLVSGSTGGDVPLPGKPNPQRAGGNPVPPKAVMVGAGTSLVGEQDEPMENKPDDATPPATHEVAAPVV